MITFLLLLFLGTTSSVEFASMHLPKNSQQIVLVRTSSWTSQTGTLQMFSKSRKGWDPVGPEIPVVVGRSGLGWGRGLQRDVQGGPQKMEGDGRAPAGIFSFGTAFGYAQEAPTGCKLPYHPATDRDYFVDDPESPQYNQWVTLSSDVSDSQRPWKSAERMRRDDYLYKLGIVVQENTNPAVKGRGSAIFLHIWRAPGLPTVGCTAMEEENLLKLVRWLDPAKNPLLIQAPDDGMNKITMGNGGNQKSK